jgi:hypothetical protein
MDQPRQSLRNVYHFTRTLNEFGLLPRLFFRAVRDVTDRQCSAFMHWGIIVDNKIFELSGNSKAIEHRFMSKPLTADEAEKFQYKEYRGKTAYTDDQILQLGKIGPRYSWQAVVASETNPLTFGSTQVNNWWTRPAIHTTS